MATCACCNCEMPPMAGAGELCPECTRAMETGVDSSLEEVPARPRVHGTKALVLINIAVYLVCVVLSSFDLKKAGAWGLEWGPATLGGR